LSDQSAYFPNRGHAPDPPRFSCFAAVLPLANIVFVVYSDGLTTIAVLDQALHIALVLEYLQDMCTLTCAIPNCTVQCVYLIAPFLKIITFLWCIHVLPVSLYKTSAWNSLWNLCETPKLEFVHLSGKTDILATLGVQKCYFEMRSNAIPLNIYQTS